MDALHLPAPSRPAKPPQTPPAHPTDEAKPPQTPPAHPTHALKVGVRRDFRWSFYQSTGIHLSLSLLFLGEPIDSGDGLEVRGQPQCSQARLPLRSELCNHMLSNDTPPPFTTPLGAQNTVDEVYRQSLPIFQIGICCRATGSSAYSNPSFWMLTVMAYFIERLHVCACRPYETWGHAPSVVPVSDRNVTPME